MRYAFPVDVDEAADGVTVLCPDMPELVTDGATLGEAIERAADALVTALYICRGWVARPAPIGGAWPAERHRNRAESRQAGAA